jgi:hypothetical protein
MSTPPGNTPNLPARQDELIVPGYGNNASPVIMVGGHQPHGSVGASFVRNVTGGILATIFLSIAGWFFHNAFWIMANALRYGKNAKVEMPDEGPTTPKPTFAEKGKAIFEKVKEKTHDLKEGAAKPVVTVMKKAEEKVEKTAKEGVEKVTEAIRGNQAPGNAPPGGLAGMMQARQEAQAKAAEERKQAAHDHLIVRARTANVTVDPAWSTARLDAEVNAAEDAAWKKRYNAACPNPRCRKPYRIRDSAKKERFKCNVCQNIFSGGAARALGTPPRPRIVYR